MNTEQTSKNIFTYKNLCLGNLSIDWTTDESTKTSLYGSIYDFVVDYKVIV